MRRFFGTNLGWTKKNGRGSKDCLFPQVVSQLGRDPWLKGSIWFHDFWLAPPEQRYWQNRETANVGLDSSVGRAPARQSGGRVFKSRSCKFFFVHLKLYPVSFPCGLLHDNHEKNVKLHFAICAENIMSKMLQSGNYCQQCDKHFKLNISNDS